MNKKITKNIIIFSFIIFSFIFVNDVSAYAFSRDSSYNNYWQNNDYYSQNNNYPYYGYNYSDNGYYNSDTQEQPTIINNYYYQTIPTTRVPSTNSNSSNTNTNTTSTVTKKEVVYQDSSFDENVIQRENTSNNNLGSSAYNSLGASAYNSYESQNRNEITALSLNGSGSFMPSSIWQWIIVVILILGIIVLVRMIKHRTEIKEETHTVNFH